MILFWSANLTKAEINEVALVEGITEYQTDNELVILLLPDNSQPKFNVNTTYFVGSRHKGRGEKGMARLLEDMLSKGTKSVNSCD